MKGALLLTIVFSFARREVRGLRSPVITCSDLPTENGGEWRCDPPHYPGQAIHVNTACVFLCEGQAVAVAYCNQFGSWMPESPEHFTCGEAPTTTTLETTRTTTASTSTTTP